MNSRDLATQVASLRSWQAKKPSANPEQHYEGFGDLVSAAVSAASSAQVGSHNIGAILEVLGVDHEAERVLDALSETPDSALAVALAGIDHPDWNTRWQLAVLLGRLATPSAVAALRHLLADDHEYVRRRALLALRDHDHELAERTSLSWLDSEHAYSRMVALDTLDMLESTHLSDALEALLTDPSDVVRARHMKIVSQQ